MDENGIPAEWGFSPGQEEVWELNGALAKDEVWTFFSGKPNGRIKVDEDLKRYVMGFMWSSSRQSRAMHRVALCKTHLARAKGALPMDGIYISSLIGIETLMAAWYTNHQEWIKPGLTLQKLFELPMQKQYDFLMGLPKGFIRFGQPQLNWIYTADNIRLTNIVDIERQVPAWARALGIELPDVFAKEALALLEQPRALPLATDSTNPDLSARVMQKVERPEIPGAESREARRKSYDAILARVLGKAE